MTTVCLPAAIVENMAEFRPEMCTEAAQQGLLQWLLKRLKVSLACGAAAPASLRSGQGSSQLAGTDLYPFAVGSALGIFWDPWPLSFLLFFLFQKKSF